jgi:hypothetical protein
MYLRNGQPWKVADDPGDPVYRHISSSAASK